MFFKVTIGLYDANIFVSVGQNHENLLLSLKKNYLKISKNIFPIGNHTKARVIHFDDGSNLIELPKANFNSPDFFESLSHEILHVAFDILNTRGFVLSRDSEEAYTYLMGFLVKEIMKKIDKQIKVPKK